MSTYTKTAGTSVLALQTVASGSVVASSAIDVSAIIAATMFIHFGRESATALTVGAIFRIEGSSKSTLDGHWYPLFTYVTDVAAVGDEAVNGTCNAGQNVVAMASTTGFAVGGIMFIQNTAIGNSEWGRIKAVSANVSVTLEDNLLNAQTGSTCYAGAQIFRAVDLNCRALTRIRLVADNTGTGQSIAVEADIVTADSFG
jgi:hypothetical protein